MDDNVETALVRALTGLRDANAKHIEAVGTGVSLQATGSTFLTLTFLLKILGGANIFGFTVLEVSSLDLAILIFASISLIIFGAFTKIVSYKEAIRGDKSTIEMLSVDFRAYTELLSKRADNMRQNSEIQNKRPPL